MGRLAAAPVHAGRRVPLLEHRLRHPRPHRRPRRRQAPARALPRADLRAARPPRDRLRPARADQRPHAHGYGIEPDGTQTDTTDWHWGVGAEGGIVSNAKDTATFLTALMRGKLLDRQQLTAMKGDNLWLGGSRAAAPTKPTAGAAAAAATRRRSGSTTTAAASPSSSSTPATVTRPSPQPTRPPTRHPQRASTATPDRRWELRQRTNATVSPRKAARRARTAARRAGTAPLVSAATRGTRRAAAPRCRR